MSTNQRQSNDPPQQPLGQILVGKGVISDDQLRIALQEQGKTHQPLGRLLVRLGFLSEATIRDSPVLGHCSGRSPWLGPRVRESCDKPNRLLTRSASNAYFSQTVAVISLSVGGMYAYQILRGCPGVRRARRDDH